MKLVIWVIGLAAMGGVVYGLWRMKARWEERSRASEERFASFMAQALPGTRVVPGAPVAPPAPAAAPGVPPVVAAAKANNELVMQRLLFEAASKAGEAGEPALAIQLYAKLLARYPQSTFATQARAAVETQKKKLAPKPV